MPLQYSWRGDFSGNTATTTMYLTDIPSCTTVTWDWNPTYPDFSQFIMSIEDVLKEMRRFQGFRDKNLFWFNGIEAGAAKRLSRLCLQAIREEQLAKVPRLQAREHKMMFKPKATSCRKWTTGRPRK